MALVWDDNLKAQTVAHYKERIEEIEEDKRPSMSSEIVAEIKEIIKKETGENATNNGIIMILSKAGVYVSQSKKKVAAGGGTGGGRRSKADSHADLVGAIEAFNQEYDAALIEKLTIKQADMFTQVLIGIQANL